MKLRLESHTLHPIHLLRYLMRLIASVLDRTWEFRYLFSDVTINPNKEGSPVWVDVFPEFKDKTPFQVDGVRLVERLGLVAEFEETEFVCLAAEAADGFDLCVWADTGLICVETDDEEMYRMLKEYFDRTAPSYGKGRSPQPLLEALVRATKRVGKGRAQTDPVVEVES